MKEERILNVLSKVDEKYIIEAEPGIKARHISPVWVRWTAITACLFLITGSILLFQNINHVPSDPQLGSIVLSNQSTVKVSYGYNDADIKIANEDLVYLTEDEMFAQERMYIFRGKVSGLTNLTIDFNGEREVRCIATIEIEKVYQGDISEGEQIKMLLPCPIAENNIWIEDTGIISQLKSGMEGIFMPMIYSEESYWEQNGAVLLKTDLAPCGLDDGMRWAFLNTENGLVFERNAYSKAANAKTLDEIEEYVIKNLK